MNMEESLYQEISRISWCWDLDSIVDTILEEETERLSDTTHCSELFREKTAATARPVVTYLDFNLVLTWLDEHDGTFKITSTSALARTWGSMKSNRTDEMNYEKISRAMRYHYGCKRNGRKGHLAMVRDRRLCYRFGELAVNWRSGEINLIPCYDHEICQAGLCLWTKE